MNGTADVEKKEERVEKRKDSSVFSSIPEEELRYGWFGFTPGFLQVGNNAKGFLVVYCFFVIVQGALVNGFVNVSISTLERRFGLQSSETGLISTGYDIAFCILAMFFTYQFSRSHRPRLVGIGCFVMGLGALIFCLPHFTTPNYEYAQDFSDECSANATDCTGTVAPGLHDYLYVFILGQLLHGAGCTPLYTLGLSFIEDTVPKESAAVYLGIGNAASIFGPVLGYGLGGVVLGYWVDFDVVDPDTIDIDSSDPRWVGAWWLGVIASMVCAFIITFPLLGFPRDFPGADRYRMMRVSETYRGEGEGGADEFKSFKKFPLALWTLLKNPTYTLTCLAGATEAMVISGFTTFLPKIIENEFQQTAGIAAVMAGVISIPGGIVGHVVAGLLVKRFNLKTSNILKFSAACCVIVCIGAPALLLYCPNEQVAGITYPYSDQTTINETLLSNCNSDCVCQEEFYIPVCGADNVNYFTACHAGCLNSTEINSTKYYSDCSCIVNVTSEGWQAVEGKCDSSCNTLGAFLGIFFLVVMFTFMSSTPALVVTFRVVPANLRSFAIGVQWVFIRALGSIPGPILFGSIIDFTCILWQTRTCSDDPGSCWIYNSKTMADNVIYISVACKIASTTLFLLANYLYKPPLETKAQETELTQQTEAVNRAFEAGDDDDVKAVESDTADQRDQDDKSDKSDKGSDEPVTVL